METVTPQIYVACLAAYNHGFLHGIWLDCDQDYDCIHAQIQEMLSNSPAQKLGEICEEWAKLLEKHGKAIAEYYARS